LVLSGLWFAKGFSCVVAWQLFDGFSVQFVITFGLIGWGLLCNATSCTKMLEQAFLQLLTAPLFYVVFGGVYPTLLDTA
jgi:hypothetical protein